MSTKVSLLSSMLLLKTSDTLRCSTTLHTRSADKNRVPETKNTEEGSARRNITRKHDHDPKK